VSSNQAAKQAKSQASAGQASDATATCRCSIFIATYAGTARARVIYYVNFQAISAAMKRNYFEATLFGYLALEGRIGKHGNARQAVYGEVGV